MNKCVFNIIFASNTLFLALYMEFASEGFLEVAIERWPESDSNLRLLKSVQTL